MGSCKVLHSGRTSPMHCIRWRPTSWKVNLYFEFLMDSRVNNISVVPLTKRPMVFWDALDKILPLVKGGDPSTLLSSGQVTVDCCVQFRASHTREAWTCCRVQQRDTKMIKGQEQKERLRGLRLFSQEKRRLVRRSYQCTQMHDGRMKSASSE